MCAKKTYCILGDGYLVLQTESFASMLYHSSPIITVDITLYMFSSVK